MSPRPSGLLSRVLLAAFATALTAGSVVAQDTGTGNATSQPSQSAPAAQPQAPASGTQASPSVSFDEVNPTHWEVFGGYSWLGINDNSGSGQAGRIPLDRHITPGFAVSTAYFVNKYIGGELLGGAHFGDRENATELALGPIVRFPMQGLSPFLHATAGLTTLSPSGLGNKLGFGSVLGGGFDLNLPNVQHFKVRVLEADYVYSHLNFFPVARLNLGNARLSGGVVWTASPITPPIPPTVACAAQPTEVFAGEPVNVTVTPSNFNPKRTVNYSYNATGGAKVAGNGPNTQVNTDGLNPGQYTVTATATDGRIKVPPTCNAAFTVKEWPAPTNMACTANPTDVDPGGTSQITASAQTIRGNLKYSYQASAGTVTGEGPNATFSAQGAQPGPATVTCTATDERGKTATATATVNVRAPQAPPPPPPPPQASKINEIAFTKPYSSRVDNTAKAILDDVALRLQREPDSKAVVIGQTDPKETSRTRSKNLAALRAANTKDYLVTEKGIDPNRIETRTDGANGMRTEIWIVPNGATFNDPNTQVTNVKPAKAPARRGPRRARAAH